MFGQLQLHILQHPAQGNRPLQVLNMTHKSLEYLATVSIYRKNETKQTPKHLCTILNKQKCSSFIIQWNKLVFSFLFFFNFSYWYYLNLYISLT